MVDVIRSAQGPGHRRRTTIAVAAVAAAGLAAGVALVGGPRPAPAPAGAAGLTRGAASPWTPHPGTVVDRDGVYLVNVELVPGTYQGTVPEDVRTCVWERRYDPTGQAPAIARGNARTGQVVTVRIEKTDVALWVVDCGYWTRIG